VTQRFVGKGLAGFIQSRTSCHAGGVLQKCLEKIGE